MLEWMCDERLWEFVSDVMVKLLNVTLQIYPCLLKICNNEMSYFCLKINNFHIFRRFKN